jgi:N-formylglutamate amidohydrolase
MDVPSTQVVRAEVSRLVIDVERFADDRLEPMAKLGMGMVYTHTHDGRPLRHSTCQLQRQSLMQTWYEPHHDHLNSLTQRCLEKYGKALVIDGHSFSTKPLPYERAESSRRPQICIGTNELHTPTWLVDALEDGFWQQGFSVGVNHPYSGCMVPSVSFGKDSRVMSVMLEIRKDLYLNEETGEKHAEFDRISKAIRMVLLSLPE